MDEPSDVQPRTDAPRRLAAPPGRSRIDVRSLRVIAAGMAAVLLCLIPLTLLAVRDHWRVPTACLLLLGVLILLWCSWRLRPSAIARRSPVIMPGSAETPSDVVSTALVVAIVPVLFSLAHLALARNLADSTMLMLTVIVAAIVLPTMRSLIILLASTCVVWAVVLTAAGLWAGPGSLLSVVELVVGVALAVNVFRLRKMMGQADRSPGDPEAAFAEEDMDVHWKNYFTEVFDASPVAVALLDERSTFIRVNPALAALFGRPAEDLIGHISGEFGHPDDASQVNEILRRMAASVAAGGTGIIRTERRYLRPDGELVTGALSVSPVRGPEGRRWLLAHVQDLTERKHVESVLQHSQATLTAVARVARCVQTGEDPRQVLAAELRWLTQASSVSILEPAESGALVVSHCIGHWAAGAQLPPGTGAPGRILLSHEPELVSTAGTDDWGFCGVTAPTGTMSCWWQPLIDDGIVTAVLAVTWDHVVSGTDAAVQAIQLLAEEAGSVLTAARVRMELETLAETDALTGLENRRGWQSHLQELTRSTQHNGEPLTLALVDLDHFKRYNDTYGHLEGDRLLHDFAARAKGMLRKADVIARWGGEEFAVALPGCSAGDAAALLNRLRVLVPDGQTCSIGYATLQPSETASDCMVRADSMLYRAKREGRNRVIGYSDVEQQPMR